MMFLGEAGLIAGALILLMLAAGAALAIVFIWRDK